VARKRKARLAEHMPANKAALYLELIASGLRRGSAYLDPRDLLTQHRLPAEVDFEMMLRLRPKRRRGRLQIDLGWSLADDGDES
jgi:hypothetical protein